MAAVARLTARMTIAEFLAWNPGDGRRWQLVDGEPHAMAPANTAHGRPMRARLCEPGFASQAFLGDPVLIMEILFPTNRAETWANVWAYTTIASVQEILILQTDAVAADPLRRLPEGSWPGRPGLFEDGLVSDSIGFQTTLAELSARTPLPR
jgi:Uma2 family endonuclease